LIDVLTGLARLDEPEQLRRANQLPVCVVRMRSTLRFINVAPT
jgi:hypothetical protein